MKLKNLFIISCVLFAGVALATGNTVLAVTAIGGMFAMSHKWESKVSVLGVAIYPAQIKDAQGQVVPMFTRAQKYLAEFLMRFGNQVTKDALNAGSLVWNPVTYYIRFAITNLSGRQQILGSNTAKAVGICNIDKGILPQYYNFCFDRIALRYATSAVTATDSPALPPGYSSVRASMPPGLANGELIVTLNDAKQIETPISDFTSNAAITGGGSRDLDGGELQVPKVWQENLQVKVEVNLPIVIPSAANTSYFVEAAFYGIEARLL